MSVSSLHPLYQKRMLQWHVIRDCVEGEDAIKNAGEVYLPKNAGWVPEQYEAYKKRARWNNYTAQNLDGLHGLIFRRNPIVTEAEDGLKNSGILSNIDRKGTSLYQFLSDTVYDLMQTSFGGYLVDMPTAPEGITTGQAEKLGIRPYVRYYPAESIINWGYQIINGVEQLAFVVLKEMVDTYVEDEFEHKPAVQYRVLDARDGIYKQRLFQEAGLDKKTQKMQYFETLIPVMINGEYLTEIPFVTLPSKEPEKPMFYDLAMCNIGHYQKSADYENGVHLTTIPTGYVTGHDKWVDPETGEEESIHLGWDSFLIFKESEAKVGNLSFSGVGLVHSETALSQALSDMAVLGSRLLVTEKGTSESADSAKIHRAGENARLATFAKNVSDKFTQVLKIIAKWIGVDTNLRVELCTDYDTLAFDPNAINALANLSEAGKLPLPALFKNLKDGEYLPADMTFDTFAIMLQLENLGYSPMEEAKIYKALLNGVKVNVQEKLPSQPVQQQTEEKEDTEEEGEK